MTLLCPRQGSVPCYGVVCALWHRGTGSCAELAMVGAVEALVTELGGIRSNLRDVVKVLDK